MLFQDSFCPSCLPSSILFFLLSLFYSINVLFSLFITCGVTRVQKSFGFVSESLPLAAEWAIGSPQTPFMANRARLPVFWTPSLILP